MTSLPWDGRVLAWAGAMRRVQALEQIRLEVVEKKTVDPPAHEKRQILFEASVLAELARASTDVGYAAGAWMEQQAEEDRLDHLQPSEAFRDFLKDRDNAQD